jgi:HlyD family secretion protein
VNPAARLFRRAALEKMASPERLDEMMRVTSPVGWLALAALGLLTGAAVLWGVFGTITTKVRGNGILLRGGAVLVVLTDAAGRVDELLQPVGARLEAGQPVARLSQPDLEERIASVRAELDQLSRSASTVVSGSQELIAELEGQLRALQERARQQEKMVSDGLITPARLIATQSEISSVRDRIQQLRLGSVDRGLLVEQKRNELRELEARRNRAVVVSSPYRGHVLERMVDVGELVDKGSPLVTLEAAEGVVSAVVYVPARDGKRLRPGMAVRLSPSTVRSEEYGFIVGTVQAVAEFPVTPEGMARVLRNAKLAETLAGKEAQLEITVALERAQTPSGFRWSSSSGPPYTVSTGTLANARIAVESKRPISYVLPILRGALGSG